MRKSIFEIENRLNIVDEFSKIINTLSENSIYYGGNTLSYFNFVDLYVFNYWNYRDTFIDLASYLKHIGIDDLIFNNFLEITEDKFLNFLELLLNMELVIKNHYGTLPSNNIRLKNILSHNIPIILEKMNYESITDMDKIYIRKRNADVDSVLDSVPENIALLLLSYNDIRNNDIESKKTILKKIDLYIDSNKKEFKEYDQKLLDAIDTIVNKMGINHYEDKHPFNSLDDDNLCEWYDKCFKMMIHLIRTKDIIEIKKERNELIKNIDKGDKDA